MARPPLDGGTVIACQGLLVDMDGVLVESADTVERHWTAWAQRRGLSVSEVLDLAHGAPVRTVIAGFVPPAEAQHEADWLEGLAFTEPGADAALPGALQLLEQDLLPVVVVTSATHGIARHRLARAGLPAPEHVIAADDVANGKPDPEPYLLAARRLSLPATACVAVEDSPTGAQAALTAGACTIGVLVSHTAEQLAGVDHLIADLASLRVIRGGIDIATAPS